MKILPTIRLAVVVLLCLGTLRAQDEAQQPSLGDIARQERARKEAARAAAGPDLGTPPPIAAENEVVGAHFLRFDGEVGPGDYAIVINGKPVLRNGRIPGLPIYVTPYLREGGNLLGIQLTSDPAKPVDISIEERFPGIHDPAVLVRFHGNAGEFPASMTKQIPFTAHPKALPNAQVTERDKVAILRLVQTFYDTLTRKDGPGVMALFAPGIEEARDIYPEGAEFGQREMANLASLVSGADFAMQPYDPTGLEMIPTGRIVTVIRTGGKPVFVSNEVADNGQHGPSRVSADVIPVKKINGIWRLTLPFGF